MKRLKSAFARWKERHWDGTSDSSELFPLGWTYPKWRLRWMWLMSDKGQFTRRTAVTVTLGLLSGLILKACNFH
jgi:hypothetical protein